MPFRINESQLGQKKIFFYILVPVYNVEKYINNCIESVLCQTYPYFKLILVDDGTPDRSGDICEEYAAKDNRIIVIHQKNMGALAARQTAIRMVREISLDNDEFILYVDSDDSLKKYALEKINKAIIENNCDMVIYGMERVSEGKTMIQYSRSAGIEKSIEDKRELYSIVFNDFQYNAVWRKAVSVSLLPDADYTDYYYISHAEDLIQSIWYYKHSKKVYFINDSLYNYTINPSSITQSVTEKNFKVDFTVRQMVYEFLLSENVFTRDDWIHYRGTCANIIADMVKKIIKFSISNKEKKRLFSEMHSSEYFLKYLNSQDYDGKVLGKRKILYVLFKKQIYLPLYLMGIVYRFLKNRNYWRSL